MGRWTRLLTRYGGRGLCMVEVHKSDLLHPPEVLAAIGGAPHRFPLSCDDLAFDSGEPQFREFEAALGGSPVAPPSNSAPASTILWEESASGGCSGEDAWRAQP